MSTILSDDETQLEIQEEETQLEYEKTQNIEDDDVSMSTKVVDANEAVEKKAVEKKREKKEPVEQVEREPGRSLFPISRVQKIIKADKEIPIVAKEATFLIALATEEFIKRLCEAGQQVAQGEKRSTIQHKDIAAVVRRADEFLFLEEIMPYTAAVAPVAPAKRPKIKPEATDNGKSGTAKAKQVTMLDHFAAGNKVDDDADDDEDIVMNEDGTMYAAGNADDEMI